jgi:hypothetical protein
MSSNCPYCPPDSQHEAWGFSPEGWAEAKRIHDENHICKECGKNKRKESDVNRIYY